ncbi:MAG TPA: glycoside hydrolase family 2 TIM barrel-domain containing protein [Bryobacteraceae bacterium]|nr:glycoside hydrolase family 2 TIM barrel-domain containing protein [Bryobacteraceae bacterium]
MKKVILFLFTVSVLCAQEIPRSEYPQPQFQREQWLTLNGRWEFEFDDANVGFEQNWASGAKKFSRTILVPYCFESKLSGIADTSFHPWVWYRRSFSVPDAWKGKRVLLNFGAVDYRSIVWVNGQRAASHTGGHVPFSIDVTPLLKAGPNVLTVRAEDPPTDRTVPRGKQYWEPQSEGIFYTRTTGIWQPVWLEAAGESYFEKVRITPSNDGTVRFDAAIARYQPGAEFHAVIRSGKDAVSSGMVRADERRVALALLVNEPKLWSVNAPNLYEVTFELRRGGAVVDRVQSYFGFRSVSTGNGRVLINGRPTYLKMLLDQGYWPESTLTPPTDEAIQYDIRIAKEMGFNGVRKHQKLEDPRFLYWADKMGFYVSDEMANAFEFDEDYVSRFTAEWIQVVDRDYNHPSVIMWVPINESWGVPNLLDSRQQNHLKALYTLTRSLDATRPVVDNDGWEHVDTTDLFAMHDYARSGDLLYEKYKDLGKPGFRMPNVSRATLVPGYEYNGTPILLSEFGGIAYIPPGAQVPADAWGYSGVEKTPEAALARLRGLYEAIAKIPAFAGVCYTQLTDVEQEINGMLTYDRKPKFDVKAVREINELLK